MALMPDCTCMMLTGAHDEKCAVIVYVRRPEYEPDLEIPVALRRRKPGQVYATWCDNCPYDGGCGVCTNPPAGVFD